MSHLFIYRTALLGAAREQQERAREKRTALKRFLAMRPICPSRGVRAEET